MSGWLDTIADRIELAKKVEKEKQQKKALKLKAMRDAMIPLLKEQVEKYGVQVELLDTDAYVYVIENGQKRGTYIPYGTDNVDIDLKIDALVNNIQSASKHKAMNTLAKGMSRAADFGEGSGRSSGGFWDNDVSLKSFDTSLNKRK